MIFPIFIRLAKFCKNMPTFTTYMKILISVLICFSSAQRYSLAGRLILKKHLVSALDQGHLRPWIDIDFQKECLPSIHREMITMCGICALGSTAQGRGTVGYRLWRIFWYSPHFAQLSAIKAVQRPDIENDLLLRDLLSDWFLNRTDCTSTDTVFYYL